MPVFHVDVLNTLKRIALAGLTAVLAINLYTGAPLLAIWVGSRVQGGTQLTMGTVAVVMGVLIAAVSVLAFLLTLVEGAYKEAVGERPTRRRATWLRSMRDERDEFVRERRPLTGFEKSLVGAVVLAAAAFEVWFFFFAGSPIG